MDTCTVFVASHRLATCPPEEVPSHLRELLRRNPQVQCLVIDDCTGQFLELDGTGTVVSPCTATEAPSGPIKSRPGRPRLGVIAREVTLLPRHWDWLATQPGGASVSLRRLVEAACDGNHAHDKASQSLQACQRAVAALANGLPHFDKVCEALRQGDFLCLGAHMRDWPMDIRLYLESFIAAAWNDECISRVRDA